MNSPGGTYPITAIAPTVAAVLGISAPAVAQEPPLAALVRDLHGVERVAVLAPDALGLSVWQHWRQEMPFLTALHSQRHFVLRSIPPPITPVNFAALVTGALLAVHGVGDMHGTLTCPSLFDAVRAAGGLSAGLGQAGCTGGEFLARYADLHGRTERRDDDAVETLLLSTVRDHAPRYLIAQFADPDRVFHRVGPTSAQAAEVIRSTDARLRHVVDELARHGYGVIVLADHGQHDYTDPEGQPRGGHDGAGGDADYLVPCTCTR